MALVVLGSIMLGSVAVAQQAPAPLPGYGSGSAAAPSAGTSANKAAVPPPVAPAASNSGQAAPPASAASAPAASGSASASADVAKTNFRALQGMKIDRPGTGSVDVQATLGDLAGDARLAGQAKDLVVRGRLTPVAERPDGIVVKVEWQGAAVPNAGDVKFPAPLVSNLLAPPGEAGGVVSPGTAVPAYGDVEGAVTAIQRALKSGGRIEKTGPTGDAGTDGKANSAVMAGSTAAKQTPQSSTFQPLIPKDEPAKAPQVSVAVKACEGTDVSFSEGMVFTKEQTITTTDGTDTVGPCVRAMPGHEIQWSYDACTNKIDTTNPAALVAQKQRWPFWVKADGTTERLGECQVDPNLKFPIKATEATCTPFANYIDKNVTVETRLAYTDTVAGTEVEYDGCRVRDGAQSWTLDETMEGCSLRPDFTAKQAYKQTRFRYIRDGVEVRLGTCGDVAEGTKYPIVSEFCAPDLTSVSKTAIEMARKVANTDTGPQVLAACAPDGTQSAIKETVEGCEAFHVDYMASLYSRGGRRFYYDFGAGKQWINQSCEESETVYTHNFVREGWVMDDTGKKGTEKLAVYIDLPAPAGRTLVSAAAVRDNSVAIPYSADVASPKDVPNNTFTDAGCMRTQGTDRSNIWDRPDGTTYAEAIGAGTPLTAVDVCTPVVQTRTVTTNYRYGCCISESCTGYLATSADGFYSRTQKTNSNNGYSTATAWNLTGTRSASFPCPIGGYTYSGGAEFTGSVCTANAGGTQAELCAAGSF
jgi:hypothetical protein